MTEPLSTAPHTTYRKTVSKLSSRVELYSAALGFELVAESIWKQADSILHGVFLYTGMFDDVNPHLEPIRKVDVFGPGFMAST